MPIDPKMGFQAGSAVLNLGSALFGNQSNANQTYTQGQAAFNTAQQMQQQSIDSQGKLHDQQAQIVTAQGAEDARVKAMEARTFAEQQALTYSGSGSGSGVLLAGTPMKVVNHTREEAAKEVAYITQAAAAQANLLRQQKLVMMNEGRAQLLGQSMQFTAQRTQAAMTASANKAGVLQSALGQLGGLFSPIGQQGAKKPLAGTGTGTPGYAPGFPAPGVP